MSDLERIRAALRRTASDGRQARRTVRYGDPREGAAAILAVADGVVLGRTVTVTWPDGRRLSADVAGRRLIRLAGDPPGGLAADHVALFQAGTLAPDDAAALAACLVALCGGEGSVAITTAPLAEPHDPALSGVGVAAVLGALDLPAPDTGAPSAGLDALIDAADAQLRHALVVEGDEVSLLRGDETEASALIDWADIVLQRVLAPEFPLLATLETAGMLIFAPGDAASDEIVVAGRLGNFLVASVAPGDVAEVIAAWRAVMG